MMAHLRDEVVHISGHPVASHESWSPSMTHSSLSSSSPSNHIQSHHPHHPASNPFYHPSPPMYIPSHGHHIHSGYNLHPQYDYYYPTYTVGPGETIEGSVCDLDQKPSLPSSIMTPCTTSSSSPGSSSLVDPSTPISIHPPTSLASSTEMMSQVRHVLESGNKSNPSSPQELHDGQQQLPPQTTGITSRPQAARSPFEWINVKKTSSSQGLMQGQTYSSSQPPPGKTRTRDKYRVVYSDHQRMELEKEFCFSQYITIRKKSELAAQLGLSERQIKIWFQNRRAKNRKIKKKHEAESKTKDPACKIQFNSSLNLHSSHTTSSTPSPPAASHPSNIHHSMHHHNIMYDNMRNVQFSTQTLSHPHHVVSSGVGLTPMSSHAPHSLPHHHHHGLHPLLGYESTAYQASA